MSASFKKNIFIQKVTAQTLLTVLGWGSVLWRWSSLLLAYSWFAYNIAGQKLYNNNQRLTIYLGAGDKLIAYSIIYACLFTSVIQPRKLWLFVNICKNGIASCRIKKYIKDSYTEYCHFTKKMF